ncbi:hypothetical protein MAPG_03487 [Magnaporthiopsis poae ATCC 64411]|uniref:RGS domain-containing protein n=1 Tax=Magnaporthiopsis poae (strain ATCC 64411 / 73-15) TaxID=644358 RepID=A0A0C4DU52_MAGP6|nr:hypothetical protein MAPG_03487 [Magnaporthiopsis poae ATCC 64411]
MSVMDKEAFGSAAVPEERNPDEGLLRRILPQRSRDAIAALRLHMAGEDDELALGSVDASSATATAALRQAPARAARGIEDLSQAMHMHDDRHRRHHQDQHARQRQSQYGVPLHAGTAHKDASKDGSYLGHLSAKRRSGMVSRFEGTVSNSPVQVRHRQEIVANEQGLPPFLPIGPAGFSGESSRRLSRQVVQRSDGSIVVPRRDSSSRPSRRAERSASPGPSKLRPRDDTGRGLWEHPPTRAEIEAAKKILQQFVMNGGGDGSPAAPRTPKTPRRGVVQEEEEEEDGQGTLTRTAATPPARRPRRVIQDESDFEDEGDGKHIPLIGGNYQVVHMDEDHHAVHCGGRTGATAGHEHDHPMANDDVFESRNTAEAGQPRGAPGAGESSPERRSPVLDHLRLYSDAAPSPIIPDDRTYSAYDFRSFDGGSVGDDGISVADSQHSYNHEDDYGHAHHASNGHRRGYSDDYGVPSILQRPSTMASGSHESVDHHRQRQPSSPPPDRELHKKFSREPPPRVTSIRPGVSASRRIGGTSIGGTSMTGGSRMPDFFGPSIFQVVLRNPTTVHQLRKYCESRFCDENIEFLQHIDLYHNRLNEIITTLTDIHKSYVSDSSPKQVNLQSSVIAQLHTDMRAMVSNTLPAMESLFTAAQESVQNLIYTDVYPGFVRHQLALSASRALAEDKTRYKGLGDCFCLTDPVKPQNPILWASDGFVSVTGYTRADIIPRNCRFLQGSQTDPEAVKRLSMAIKERRETVELLLNYKKNKQPFWNLLYCAPLYDEAGNLAFFIGGQVNCSTTIHSSVDVMRVLSMSAEGDYVKEMEDKQRQEKEKARTQAKLAADRGGQPSNGSACKNKGGSTRRSLLKVLGVRLGSSNGHTAATVEEEHKPTPVIENVEAGMEQKVLERMEGQELDAQKKEFYTAYSKYIVVDSGFIIRFYSAGITEMLHPANNAAGTIVGTDVFTFLKRNGLPQRPAQQQQQLQQQQGGHTVSGDASPEYKDRVQAAVVGQGSPISIEVRMQTRRSAVFRGDERFAAHWTPLKDDAGRVGWVVLTLGNMMM